jgi:hypothetical protein
MSLHIFACPKTKVGAYVGTMFGSSLLSLIYNISSFIFIYLFIWKKNYKTLCKTTYGTTPMPKQCLLGYIEHLPLVTMVVMNETMILIKLTTHIIYNHDKISHYFACIIHSSNKPINNSQYLSLY